MAIEVVEPENADVEKRRSCVTAKTHKGKEGLWERRASDVEGYSM